MPLCEFPPRREYQEHSPRCATVRSFPRVCSEGVYRICSLNTELAKAIDRTLLSSFPHVYTCTTSSAGSENSGGAPLEADTIGVSVNSSLLAFYNLPTPLQSSIVMFARGSGDTAMGDGEDRARTLPFPHSPPRHAS